jgi:hypothetical protein
MPQSSGPCPGRLKRRDCPCITRMSSSCRRGCPCGPHRLWRHPHGDGLPGRSPGQRTLAPALDAYPHCTSGGPWRIALHGRHVAVSPEHHPTDRLLEPSVGSPALKSVPVTRARHRYRVSRSPAPTPGRGPDFGASCAPLRPPCVRRADLSGLERIEMPAGDQPRKRWTRLNHATFGSISGGGGIRTSAKACASGPSGGPIHLVWHPPIYNATMVYGYCLD